MEININNNSTTFQLHPTFPVKGEKTVWQTLQNGKAVDSLMVTFDNHNSAINFAQEATLILEMAVEGWSFFGNGIEYCQAIDNCNYNLRSYVSSDNKTLVLKIANVGQTQQFINAENPGLPIPLDQVVAVNLATATPSDADLAISFRYVVQFADPDAAEPQIFMSQDPGVIIRRPPVER